MTIGQSRYPSRASVDAGSAYRGTPSVGRRAYRATKAEQNGGQPARSRLIRQSWFTNLLLILVIVFYGSLGRDVFFNHLAEGTDSDPIGAVLVYFRLFTCLVAVLAVVQAIGVGPAIAAVPKLFVPYLMLALVSCLWADLVKETFRAAVVLTALYLGMSLLFTRMGLVQIARLMLQIIAAVLVLSALLAVFVPSVGRHTGLEALQGVHAGRWRGIFSHKNGLGPWAAFGSVLLFTHARFGSGPRLYWWFARACALACLFFSGSATSIIGAATLLFCFGLFRIRERSGGALALLTMFGGVIVMGMMLFLFSDFLFELLGRDATLTGRTSIWQFAWDYIQTAPFIGHGYQSLGGPEFLDAEASILNQAIPGPENMYLASLLDLGVVGLTLFFGPVLLGLTRAIAALPKLTDADERDASTMMVIIVISALFMGVTETTPFICTGFDGVVCFTALFAILIVPASLRRRPSSGVPVRRASAPVAVSQPLQVQAL